MPHGVLCTSISTKVEDSADHGDPVNLSLSRLSSSPQFGRLYVALTCAASWPGSGASNAAKMPSTGRRSGRLLPCFEAQTILVKWMRNMYFQSIQNQLPSCYSLRSYIRSAESRECDGRIHLASFASPIRSAFVTFYWLIYVPRVASVVLRYPDNNA